MAGLLLEKPDTPAAQSALASGPEPQLHSILERDALIRCARRVPAGGSIVEIGTGGGGTSVLLRQYADRLVHISSIDLNQHTHQTRQILAGHEISFVDGASDTASAGWQHPIDFLFVDGGHRLSDVWTDFTAWYPHLVPGARIAFHDYDEPIAGGVFYLGVKLMVDTLLRLKILVNPEQDTTLLSARVSKSPEAGTLTVDALRTTLQAHAGLVASLCNHFTPSLLHWLRRNDGTRSRQVVEAGPIIPIEHPHSETRSICQHLNQLTMCYLFDRWMKEYWSDAVALTPVADIGLFQEMMRWIDAERRRPYPTVCALEQIINRDFYPDSLAGYDLSTIEAISRFLTLEQVRLNMLYRITRPIFERVLDGYL